MEQQFVVARHIKPYPWKVVDTKDNKSVAFTANLETAEDWARQLNDKGYVEVDD